MIALQTWVAVKEDELDMILLDYMFLSAHNEKAIPRNQALKDLAHSTVRCLDKKNINLTNTVLFVHQVSETETNTSS